MTGLEVKNKLKSCGIALNVVAKNMGITAQNLDEKLKVKNIKIGTIQKIAVAADKPLDFFIENQVKTLSKEPIPEYGISNIEKALKIIQQQADSLAVKDEQINRLITILENNIKK